MRVIRMMVVLWFVGGMAACASLHAGPPSVRQALEAPEPPPRTVIAVPEEPVSSAPTPVIVPAPPYVPRHLRPRPQRPAVDKPDPPAVVAPPAPPETPPRATSDPPAGSVALQTTVHVDEVERRVRDMLANAVKDLAQVDERTLSAAAKTQYDAARRFVAQAEEALKAKNLVFAEQLADKAQGLATGLRGR
jgi:hypothetical protein